MKDISKGKNIKNGFYSGIKMKKTNFNLWQHKIFPTKVCITTCFFFSIKCCYLLENLEFVLDNQYVCFI